MGYRQLATRPVLVWALVAVGARLPVAMAPLALVFLVRERPGGYAVGAGLAAAYVIGEVVGAAVLGPRLRPERARRQLAAGLAVGAGAFAGLGLLPHAHPLVLGALAAVAGAAPGAAPGGLRTLLTSLLPEALVVKALSVESVLTYAVVPPPVPDGSTAHARGRRHRPRVRRHVAPGSTRVSDRAGGSVECRGDRGSHGVVAGVVGV